MYVPSLCLKQNLPPPLPIKLLCLILAIPHVHDTCMLVYVCRHMRDVNAKYRQIYALAKRDDVTYNVKAEIRHFQTILKSQISSLSPRHGLLPSTIHSNFVTDVVLRVYETPVLGKSIKIRC